MARKLSLTITTDAENAAAIMEAIESLDMATDIRLTSGKLTPSRGTDDDDDEPEPVKVRQTVRAHVTRRAANSNIGRRVVYTPAVTQRKIDAAMERLQPSSLSAFILKRFSRSSKPLTKRQLLDAAEKHGHNPESVDNVVWRFQKDGVIKSVAIDE